LASIGAITLSVPAVISTLPLGTSPPAPSTPSTVVDDPASVVGDDRPVNNGVPFATVKVWSTGGALANVFFSGGCGFGVPDWDARIVTAPAPVRCTTPPTTVAGPETMENVTGRFDEAVALTAKSASP
jgi:hypothetical protein